MTQEEARAQYNYLMTLCIRKEESFGPLAMAFIKDHDLDQLGLMPEEQFNLMMALVESFPTELKKHRQKVECLEKAAALLPRTRFYDVRFERDLRQEIQKLEAELEIFNQASRTGQSRSSDKLRIIVESDLPDYFLNTAQRRAQTYYQQKFKLPHEAHLAQPFTHPPAYRKFEPDNTVIHKEYPGSCPPFVSARAGAFHVMLPFDLKISRRPDDPLPAGVRIWYSKPGYSFPLRSEWGQLCGYFDNRVVDVPLNDPHLLFVSVSPVQESELGPVTRPLPEDAPADCALSLAFLYGTVALGTYIQMSCNIKVWFDASQISLLLQGAPDLYEYGVIGGAGLVTRTYGMEKVEAYAETLRKPWRDGLSFNFINLHLQLLPGVDTAMIPYNTPIFSVYPVLARQTWKFEDARTLE